MQKRYIIPLVLVFVLMSAAMVSAQKLYRSRQYVHQNMANPQQRNDDLDNELQAGFRLRHTDVCPEFGKPSLQRRSGSDG